MGKKRLRGGRQNNHQGTTTSTVTTSARRGRVRNRLLVSVTLCAVAVLAAGAPGVATASRDLTDSQRLVDRAELGRRAVSLSHALADERDAVVRLIATGGAADGGEGLPEKESARVDRGIRELRADAPAGVRRLLDAFPDTRRQAVAGKSDATEAYEAYTEVIQSLGGITAATTRALPGRAENATADALPDLGRAVERASAARGLLLAALAAGGEQERLTTAAQQAYLREQAALADFDQTARPAARDAYARTVTGTDVHRAERYLARLTDQPRLDYQDLALDADRVAAALAARVDRMRSMESSLATAEVKRLEKLRNDDVTALELNAALLGACLLLTLGISVQTARSMTRPLAVLRRGSQRVAADPAGEEPVVYKGRNDEFADVVRAVNRLRDTAAALHERAARAGGTGERQDAPAGASGGAPDTSVRLTRRTLDLVERQLSLIEGMEHEEKEPDRLAALYELDHLATRMRRHSENLLILAGAGAGDAAGHREPVSLLDVLRAAVSEVEHYERVGLAPEFPRARVSGAAADDLSHLIAELVDNAVAYSPPEAGVRLSVWLLESGEITLSVQDEGTGLTAERLAELNARLEEWGAQEPSVRPQGPSGEDDASGLGLYVVARLAARHGIRVRLSAQEQGGTAAVVTLPHALLVDEDDEDTAEPVAGEEAAAPALPGRAGEEDTGAADEATADGTAADKTAVETAEGRAAAEDTGSGDRTTAGPAAPEQAADTVSIPAVGTGPTAGGGTSGGDAKADVDVAAADEAAADPARDALVRVAGPYLVEPDEHTRARDEAPAPAPGSAPAPEAVPGAVPAPRPAPAGEAVTAKGLPRRKPAEAAAGVARPRTGGLKAEELRQRLGGFHQGARDGRRDAEAGVEAEENGPGRPAGEQPTDTGDTGDTSGTGGTVEEART